VIAAATEGCAKDRGIVDALADRLIQLGARGDHHWIQYEIHHRLLLK
jgi:hypothetical protein